jgi:molybdopterin-guanine dinucleotide biosynthesis protein B
MRNGPPVIGFAGPSGIGKTSLLERVVGELARAGVRVGVVKHTCHPVLADRPGKDSQRLYQAGAGAVALAGPDQIATFTRRERAPRLEDALQTLPEDIEVVLVEGYMWEPIPRYVLLPPQSEETDRYLGAHPILRVIHPPPTAAGERPDFDPGLVAELAAEIAEWAGRPRRRTPSTEETRQ